MPTRQRNTETAITATFIKERETKGTWRYAEDSEEPIIGTLYLKKPVVERLGSPESLTVTVEAI